MIRGISLFFISMLGAFSIFQLSAQGNLDSDGDGLSDALEKRLQQRGVDADPFKANPYYPMAMGNYEKRDYLFYSAKDPSKPVILRFSYFPRSSQSRSGPGGGQSGGGQGGGLFPVDPNGEPPSEPKKDEICIQTLVPIGNLGGGRVQYVVADAGCDPEPGGICIAGCKLTKDDIIIGIDVVGLLGG
jgi:hypothetical protein